ncbi:hypothetical protein HYV79_03195 [Candidatus Woesearchaeota archaeon]|nr:hypothetical protein [Candidatus Woesearchaeota archaeon]
MALHSNKPNNDEDKKELQKKLHNDTKRFYVDSYKERIETRRLIKTTQCYSKVYLAKVHDKMKDIEACLKSAPPDPNQFDAIKNIADTVISDNDLFVKLDEKFVSTYKDMRGYFEKIIEIMSWQGDKLEKKKHLRKQVETYMDYYRLAF